MIDEAVRYFNENRLLLKLGRLSSEEYLREYVKDTNAAVISL